MKDWTKLEKTVIITIFFPGMNSPIYWTCNKIVQFHSNKMSANNKTQNMLKTPDGQSEFLNRRIYGTKPENVNDTSGVVKSLK